MRYLVFAVIFLHFMCAPIIVGADVLVDFEEKRAKLTVRLLFLPVFIKKLDINSIRARITGQGRPQNNSSKKSDFSSKGYFIRAALLLIKVIKARHLSLYTVIGTGDPALTALSTGSIKIAFDDIAAALGCNGVSEISPDYDSERIFIDFSGIISLRFTDIIYAAFGAIKPNKGKKGGRKAHEYVVTE